MAAPNSTNEVTVRRLSSVITGMWAKITTKFGNKADKVTGATNGNFAGLDANGNLIDSGKNASDFKPIQNAVGDPTASGTGIQFISGITQDANGVITPAKKSVRSASTSQTGIVQLAGTIGATVTSENNKAASEKAVRDAINAAISHAYHAAGTKTVAELTSSLLVAANEGAVYNMTDGGTTTADFVEGAGKTIRAGDNVGICAVENDGTITYKFDLLSGFVDLSNYIQKSSTAGLVKNDGSIDTNTYLTTTGNASNTTVTFTAASSRTNITTGEKLSVMFGKIAKWLGDLKALAFKDKVADADISGTISDSHIASAGTWNNKADKVSSATSGNFAGLDANGNLTDSGSKAADFAQAAHTHAIDLTSDTGTPAIDLAANTTYKLTAGGTAILFKTPVDNDSKVTSVGNHYAPAEDSAAEKDASGGSAAQLPTSSTGTLVQVITGLKMDAKGHVTGIICKGLWSPDNNTTYTDPKLGFGYASATSGTSPAFTAAISNFTLGGGNGGIVCVKFSAAVPASATLNINSTGAKNIYWKNAAITAGVIQSGDTAVLVYDGTRYQLLGVDRSVKEMTTDEVDTLLAELT